MYIELHTWKSEGTPRYMHWFALFLTHYCLDKMHWVAHMKSEKKNCLDKCTELPLFLTYFCLVWCIELPNLLEVAVIAVVLSIRRAVGRHSWGDLPIVVVLHKVEELRKVCEDERVVWLERWPARPHLAMFSVLHGHLLLQILELLVNLSTKN